MCRSFDIAEAIPVAVGAPMSTDERKMEEERLRVRSEAKTTTAAERLAPERSGRAATCARPSTFC